jgi:hypothetical protein
MPTKEIRSSVSSVTSVAASMSNTQILAPNADRLGAIIFNDSNSNLYLKLGTDASKTSFTILLGKQDYYEIPSNYIGAIYGVWGIAIGNARVTELV